MEIVIVRISDGLFSDNKAGINCQKKGLDLIAQNDANCQKKDLIVRKRN